MFKSINFLTIVNLFLILSAVVNSIVLANTFGTSRDIEVYFAAIVLFNIFVKISQVGQLAEIFLPHYNNTKFESSKENAQNEFSVILNWMFLFSFLISILFYLLSPIFINIIMPGFTEEDRNLGINLMSLIAPLIILQIVTSTLKIIINAEEIYSKVEVLELLSKIIGIILIVFTHDYFQIYSLIFAIWLGLLLKFFGVIYILIISGFKYSFILNHHNFNIVDLYKKLISLYGYVGATQVYTIVFTSALSLLPQGSLAVYKYVENMYASLGGVLIRPVGIVFFSNFSKFYSSGSHLINNLAEKALSYVLCLLFIVIASLIFSLDGYLNLIWGNENFDLEKIRLSSRLLLFLLLIVFIDALNIIGRRIVACVGLINKQYFYTTMVQFFCCLLVYPFFDYFGVIGTVILLSLNSFLLGLVPLFLIYANAYQFRIMYNFLTLFKWICSFVFTYIIIYLIQLFSMFDVSDGKLLYAFESFYLSIAAVVTLLFCSYVCNIKEVVDLLKFSKQKIKDLF